MSKAEDTVVRILPYQYIHVEDRNSNLTRLEVGPQIFIRKMNEALVLRKPKQMITLAARSFCAIRNPIVRDANGNVVSTSFGQVECNRGEIEYRFYKDYSVPFPLYPGEELLGPENQELEIISNNEGLKLRATRKHTDVNGVERLPGDLWLERGLSTYYPSNNQEVVETVLISVILENIALRLKASIDLVDQKGVYRKAGEEWLITENGSYLPGAYEMNLGFENAYILTDEKAIMLKAKRSFLDKRGVKRGAGDVWLVTNKETSTHTVDINEEFEKVVKLTV